MARRIRRETALRTILASAPLALFTTDLQGIFTVSEGGLLPSLGFQSDETLGKSALDLCAGVLSVDAEQPPVAMSELLRRVFAGESLTVGTDVNGVFCEGRLVPIRDAADHIVGLLGVAIDATARKVAEVASNDATERLRWFSERLLTARESERRYLARELHDEIGQALFATKMELEAARDLASDAGAVSSRLEVSIGLVEHALQQVRSRSLDLHPVLLDDLGLAPALRVLAEQQATRGRLLLTFGGMTDLRFPNTVELACFRIVQEALANIVKHARARSVNVELREQDRHLHVWIRDDGVGFDIGDARRRTARGQSLGLMSMEERAALAGGRIEWRRSESGGTEVHAWFDLQQTAAANDRVPDAGR